jgi:hypothetical protein
MAFDRDDFGGAPAVETQDRLRVPVEKAGIRYI